MFLSAFPEDDNNGAPSEYDTSAHSPTHIISMKPARSEQVFNFNRFLKFIVRHLTDLNMDLT